MYDQYIETTLFFHFELSIKFVYMFKFEFGLLAIAMNFNYFDVMYPANYFSFFVEDIN